MLNDIKVKESEVPTNLDAIKVFETKWGIKLPSDYIEWLLRHNGGSPIYNAYNMLDRRLYNDGRIAWFYALYDGDACNLEKEKIFWHEYSNRIPRELIPIADTGIDSDRICICVDDKNYGKIYLWVHQYEDYVEGREPWWHNVCLIANSFTDFINGLYKYELDHDRNEICTYQDGRVEFIPNTDRPNAE